MKIIFRDVTKLSQQIWLGVKRIFLESTLQTFRHRRNLVEVGCDCDFITAYWQVAELCCSKFYTGCFFLLVTPKSGYVPGLVVKYEKKSWSMGFYKGI